MPRLARWAFSKDNEIFYYINRGCRSPILNFLMPWVTEFGGPTFTIVSSLLLIVLGHGIWKSAALDTIIALTVSHVAAYFVKRLITRPRPYLVLPEAYTVEFPLTDPSFPSGHTTAAFALAVTYLLYFPVLTMPLLFLACATGISRIYLGLHYPSDVVMGALFGTVAAVLCFIY